MNEEYPHGLDEIFENMANYMREEMFYIGKSFKKFYFKFGEQETEECSLKFMSAFSELIELYKGMLDKELKASDKLH